MVCYIIELYSKNKRKDMVMDYEANSSNAYEALCEALYSNAVLSELCHEYAVKHTFEDVPHDVPMSLFFIQNPGNEEAVMNVLCEEWSTEEFRLAYPTAHAKYQSLYEKYWNWRAYWWYELIGGMHLKNQLEAARIAMFRK